MNEVIKQLQNRRSVREFTGEKIKEEFTDNARNSSKGGKFS